MPELNWTAILEDGTTIPQFYEDGKEVSFKTVQENESKLIVFSLSNEKEFYSVNIEKGFFSINGQKLYFGIEGKYRLIYFKRRRSNFSIGAIASITEEEPEYWIGWQTTIEGKNYKRMLKIFQEKVQIMEDV